MRSLEELIERAREQSDNANYGDAEGLSQNEFVEFFNDAQTNIFLRILAEVPDTALFDAEASESITAGTRTYGTSARWGIKNAVRLVEYSPTNRTEDYYPLSPRSIRELTRQEVMYPSCYAIQNGLVLLSPVPSSSQGSLKITYVQRPNTLDIRRGKIDSLTGTYSTLTLDSSPAPDDGFAESTKYPRYLCVCDDFGGVNYFNALASSYDSPTLTLTLTGSGTSGGTIAADNWITFGQYSTTHSSLPEEFERYLITYATVEALKRDSSKDAGDFNAKLRDLEQNLIALAQNSTRDLYDIPVTNEFYRV